MKYQITLDKDYILYDLRESSLILENPELDLTISKVGKLTFSIYPDHPHFNKIEKKSSKIETFKDGKTIFRGRVVSDEQGIYNNKFILCESALSYLNDSIVRPGSFSGSPLEFLTMVLSNHNSQVTDDQKLKLGNVSVVDPNNYISRSWEDYITSWEMIEKRGLDLVGGYLVERYEDDGTYIDWVDDFSETSTQVIEFGENLINIVAKNDSTNTYTVVIPLGAEFEKEDGTKERLTIKSVNNNLDYLVNQDAVNRYGWIVAPISETTWDDVTLASNLKTKGTEYLNTQAVMLKTTIEITALDLQATDTNIESFFIYEYVRVKSDIHNINKLFLLSSIKIPLGHPENTTITLGEEVNSLTGIQLGESKAIKEGISKIEKDYKINETKVNELEKSINYFSVDLAQYNLTIPTSADKKPLETKNYDINFYGYFKGQQITPTVSISGSNSGISVSKASSYIRFSVNSNTAINNTLNEYAITFSYTLDGQIYNTTKIIDIALAIKGSDGSPGSAGSNGKSAYQIWLDAGNTGTEEEYLASLKGDDGKDGSNGISVVSVDVQYYHSTSSTSLTGGSWSSTAPGWVDGKYVWSKTVITYSTGAVEETNPACITGPKGSTGSSGAAGVGISSIIEEYYQSTSNTTQTGGTWVTTAPSWANGKYIWTRSVITYTNGNVITTTPICVSGSKGDTGASGVSSYTHIRYSANADGTSYTSSPTSTTKYMGIAVTTSTTAPTDKSGYSWAEIKGADGTNGSNGSPGKDGVTYYTWIKYADTPTSGMSNTPDNKKYMGIAYNKLTATESTNYGDYAWSLIKGLDGSPGSDGADGISSYIHIRYSPNADGSSMTSTPGSNTQYLGTATTTSSTAPTSSSSYTWVKIKGDAGTPGAAGKDGVSYYFYVRYSANANGNPMTAAPGDTTKYMGVASTTATTAPTSYTAYTWTLIKGSDGATGPQGSPGQAGADGKSSYLHIKYSNDGTTFTANNGEDVGRYRGELVDNNPTDSTTFNDYTWYDMALIVEEELEEIRREVLNNTSLIEQTDTQIRLDVAQEYVSTGTFDEFKSETNTQFIVQADGIETKFSEITLLVENVENETQSQFRELSSYIRGYQNENGQPVIELGSNTSNIILRQLNDRIQFVQNGVEVAYITNNTLYINDGTFLQSLRIGNYAFFPRTNGSLDFKKVSS